MAQPISNQNKPSRSVAHSENEVSPRSKKNEKEIHTVRAHTEMNDDSYPYASSFDTISISPTKGNSEASSTRILPLSSNPRFLTPDEHIKTSRPGQITRCQSSTSIESTFLAHIEKKKSRDSGDEDEGLNDDPFTTLPMIPNHTRSFSSSGPTTPEHFPSTRFSSLLIADGKLQDSAPPKKRKSSEGGEIILRRKKKRKKKKAEGDGDGKGEGEKEEEEEEGEENEIKKAEGMQFNPEERGETAMGKNVPDNSSNETNNTTTTSMTTTKQNEVPLRPLDSSNSNSNMTNNNNNGITNSHHSVEVNTPRQCSPATTVMGISSASPSSSHHHHRHHHTGPVGAGKDKTTGKAVLISSMEAIPSAVSPAISILRRPAPLNTSFLDAVNNSTHDKPHFLQIGGGGGEGSPRSSLLSGTLFGGRTGRMMDGGCSSVPTSPHNSPFTAIGVAEAGGKKKYQAKKRKFAAKIQSLSVPPCSYYPRISEAFVSITHDSESLSPSFSSPQAHVHHPALQNFLHNRRESEFCDMDDLTQRDPIRASFDASPTSLPSAFSGWNRGKFTKKRIPGGGEGGGGEERVVHFSLAGTLSDREGDGVSPNCPLLQERQCSSSTLGFNSSFRPFSTFPTPSISPLQPVLNGPQNASFASVYHRLSQGKGGGGSPGVGGEGRPHASFPFSSTVFPATAPLRLEGRRTESQRYSLPPCPPYRIPLYDQAVFKYVFDSLYSERITLWQLVFLASAVGMFLVNILMTIVNVLFTLTLEEEISTWIRSVAEVCFILEFAIVATCVVGLVIVVIDAFWKNNIGTSLAHDTSSLITVGGSFSVLRFFGLATPLFAMRRIVPIFQRANTKKDYMLGVISILLWIAVCFVSFLVLISKMAQVYFALVLNISEWTLIDYIRFLGLCVNISRVDDSYFKEMSVLLDAVHRHYYFPGEVQEVHPYERPCLLSRIRIRLGIPDYMYFTLFDTIYNFHWRTKYEREEMVRQLLHSQRAKLKNIEMERKKREANGRKDDPEEEERDEMGMKGTVHGEGELRRRRGGREGGENIQGSFAASSSPALKQRSNSSSQNQMTMRKPQPTLAESVLRAEETVEKRRQQAQAEETPNARKKQEGAVVVVAEEEEENNLLPRRHHRPVTPHSPDICEVKHEATLTLPFINKVQQHSFRSSSSSSIHPQRHSTSEANSSGFETSPLGNPVHHPREILSPNLFDDYQIEGLVKQLKEIQTDEHLFRPSCLSRGKRFWLMLNYLAFIFEVDPVQLRRYLQMTQSPLPFYQIGREAFMKSFMESDVVGMDTAIRHSEPQTRSTANYALEDPQQFFSSFTCDDGMGLWNSTACAEQWNSKDFERMKEMGRCFQMAEKFK